MTRRSGSSPRMRGQLSLLMTAPHPKRIIPAYAGPTSGCRSVCRARTDHPRVCGANTRGQFTITVNCGSSPRMRGQRCRSSLRRPCCRIIPAYAGPTDSEPLFTPLCPDHPRVCGANMPRWTRRSRPCGSSPRMRGQLDAGTYRVIVLRIIPAYAGPTPGLAACQGMGSDHPRVCGANQPGMRHKGRRSGSSPRMRGQLDRFAAGE